MLVGGRLEEWMEPEPEIVKIMEDTEAHRNFGRVSSILDDEHSTATSMALSDAQLRGVGYLVPMGDESYYGLVAHRGVLSDAEYETLDWDTVQIMVYERLGAGPETLEYLYETTGPPTEDRRLKRAIIDNRLLAIQENGGNMSALAGILGWHIRENGECRKMSQALARARANRGSANGS